MKKTLTIFIVILSLSILGCANYDDVDPDKMDATYASHQLKGKTKIGLLAPEELLNLPENPGFIKINGFNAYKRWWCIKNKPFESIAREHYKNYCKSIDGVQSGDWCQTKDGYPLFYANWGNAFLVQKEHLFEGRHCTPTTIGVGAITITNEKTPMDSRWVSYATKNGFVSRNDIAQDLKKAISKELFVREGISYLVTASKGNLMCRKDKNSGLTVIPAYVTKVKKGQIKLFDGHDEFWISTNSYSYVDVKGIKKVAFNGWFECERT